MTIVFFSVKDYDKIISYGSQTLGLVAYFECLVW